MEFGSVLLTAHARTQMSRRGIEETDVRAVLDRPDDILDVRSGRMVAQAMFGDYLLRVFVDVDREPAEVVTAYRTSRLEKYRRKS